MRGPCGLRPRTCAACSIRRWSCSVVLAGRAARRARPSDHQPVHLHAAARRRVRTGQRCAAGEACLATSAARERLRQRLRQQLGPDRDTALTAAAARCGSPSRSAALTSSHRATSPEPNRPAPPFPGRTAPACPPAKCSCSRLSSRRCTVFPTRTATTAPIAPEFAPRPLRRTLSQLPIAVISLRRICGLPSRSLITTSSLPSSSRSPIARPRLTRSSVNTVRPALPPRRTCHRRGCGTATCAGGIQPTRAALLCRVAGRRDR